MALIKCSNCGKKYSNLLSVCKHCKYKITKVNEKGINEEKTYKNKDNVTQSKIIRKQTLIWVILIVLAIVVIRKRYQEKKAMEPRTKEYEKNLEYIIKLNNENKKFIEEADRISKEWKEQDEKMKEEMERIDKELDESVKILNNIKQ